MSARRQVLAIGARASACDARVCHPGSYKSSEPRTRVNVCLPGPHLHTACLHWPASVLTAGRKHSAVGTSGGRMEGGRQRREIDRPVTMKKGQCAFQQEWDVKKGQAEGKIDATRDRVTETETHRILRQTQEQRGHSHHATKAGENCRNQSSHSQWKVRDQRRGGQG